jgi:putative ABC transport system ATP-binding protein
LLQVKGVSKIYGKRENAFSALDDISVTFKPGSTNAIVGKSGSGKSTLLHILTGLDRPTTGDVLDTDKSIFKNFDTDTWRGQNIGIVFQQFFLQPNNSVLENVALPLKIQGVKKKLRTSQATEALEKVGLTDKAKSRANDLSGGQKQRVAIARALVGNPSILIADEPTGNLDSENGAIIEDLLFELNKKFKTTIIIVTHDEDLAKRCQNVIRLRDGKLVSGEKKGGK